VQFRFDTLPTSGFHYSNQIVRLSYQSTKVLKAQYVDGTTNVRLSNLLISSYSDHTERCAAP